MLCRKRPQSRLLLGALYVMSAFLYKMYLSMHLRKQFFYYHPNECKCLMSFQCRYARAILESPLTRHRWHTTDWRSYGADRGNVSFLDHSFPVARKSVELRNWASVDVPLDQHRHILDNLCSKNSHSIADFVSAFL